MQISALNSLNSFKGEIKDVELISVSRPNYGNTDLADKLDKTDFKAIAGMLNEGKPEDKKASPARFFATSLLLTAASFFAAYKASNTALKTVVNKLSLDKPLNKLGVTIYRAIQSISKKPNIDVSGVKTFFTGNANKALKWFAHTIEDFGKKGLTEIEKRNFAQLMGKNIPEGALYAKNAIMKGIGAILGAGTAGFTVQNRYQDDDGNGIPDKLEHKNGFSLLKDCQEALPKLATACELVG